MEYINDEAIERIEKELSSRIIELYDLNTECLLYDITNFYTFIPEHEGNITLDYAVNKTVYNEKRKSFGKMILFTNNHEWSTTQIIKVYRGKAKIEDDFRRMKSPIIISYQVL